MGIFLLTTLFSKAVSNNTHFSFLTMVLIIMDDKTPQQLLVEYVDFIRHTIIKTNISKNYKLDEEDINDIFQIICEKLLNKGIADYKGNSKFETYLFRIIHNEMTTYVKRKNKEIIASQSNINQSEENDNKDNYIKIFDYYHTINIDFENRIVINDILNIIDQTLATFDERDKLIFRWYFLCKKTQSEVALMVKLSQPSVNERIEKIRKTIIKEVKKKYPGVVEELLS